MTGARPGRRTRPVIGVTGPDEGGAAAWWFTRFAVRRAGGRARRITPKRPADAAALDGLILGGGADVAPALYGEEAPSLADAVREDDRVEEDGRGLRGLGRRLVSGLALVLRRILARKRPTSSGDPGRDEIEVALIRQAEAEGKPVLGICRGAQLLNVQFGGTLHQDLEAFYVETPQIRTLRPRKRVEVEEGSLLSRIFGTRTCRVNALHRQAVDRLAEGLRVSAREPNGVVQAIEHPGRPFLLGVQWHPEYLPQVRRQRRLFEALVEEARRHRAPC